MKRIGLFLLFAFAACFLHSQSVIFSSNTDVPVLPDNGCTNDDSGIGTGLGGITSSIMVSGVGTLNWAGGTTLLDSVSISMSHTWRGDMQVALVAPTGQTLILANNVDGSADNFHARFANVVSPLVGDPLIGCGLPANCITDPGLEVAPLGGSLMSAFDGVNADGAWTLQTCDRATGDLGVLLYWGLAFKTPAAPTNWYADTDTDGFGDPAVVLSSIPQPPGYVADNTDCDDTDNAKFPGNPEVCDGKDNDCNLLIDDGIPLNTYYADTDGDGYGDAAGLTTMACSPPPGYVSDNTDCDDTDNAVFPGAFELCNGVDDDCDGNGDGPSNGPPTPTCGYLIGFSPFQDSVWTVDTANAYTVVGRFAPTLAGFTITGVNGAARHPVTGVYYAIAKVSGVSGRVLCTFDPATFVMTQVGNMGDNFSSITFSPTGQCFGVTGNGGTNPETLYNINLATGAPTLLTALGNGADGEVICYNPDDNLIYHWSGNGTVVYETVLPVPPYTVTNIPITGTTNGETFGAAYIGNNKFIISNISSSLNIITTTGTWGAQFGAMPDDLRGLPFGDCGVCYADADGDGFGDPATTSPFGGSCGTGFVQDNTDCNDGNIAIYPCAPETCDGIDNDCDGAIDTDDPDYVDNTPPTAVCGNTSVALDASGNATLPTAVSVTVETPGFGDETTWTLTNAANVVIASGGPYAFGSTNTASVAATGGPFAFNIQTIGSFNDNVANYSVDCVPNGNMAQGTVNGGSSASATGLACVGLPYTVSDNCGVASVSISSTAFNCSNYGANNVTVTVTDQAGNTGNCTSVVTVQDNIAPTVTCKNISVNLSATGSVTVTPAQLHNSSSDNCTAINLVSVTPALFTCTNLGSNNATLLINDGHGNTATCIGVVTVADNLAPVPHCQNITKHLDAGGTTSVTPAEVNNASTDNCGSVNLVSAVPSSFTCANLGANPVLLTMNDGHGNTSTCTATVTVADNAPPVITCQPLAPMLNAQGEVFLTPAQVYLSGTDNCGMVNLVSVSPSYFNCNNAGVQTVTLSANDGHGNTGTCQASVTIPSGFVTITNIVVTPADCEQANGSIVISATTLGGQLGYSLNGGTSFNFTGVFTSLSAGNYNVLVAAFGTASCTANGSVTVNSLGSVQAWYKDLDNDGYSDGQSQQACTQPPGYKLPANLTNTNGDCNDNDPLQKPGQVWLKDTDSDGYSNGVLLIQCARPAGFKVTGELLGASLDCNDANAAIHPGAAEICNSLDDDCDGLIDEGTTGGLTFVGNISLTSQVAVNNFSACYSVIQGNLLVQNNGVTSLANLANLVKVTGNVTIKNTSLLNMNGLHSLDTIGGNLTINGNNFGVKLHSLDGLEDLDWVGGNLKVYQNYTLTDCCAIHDLIGAEPNGVGGIISIYSNLTTCDNVAAINTDCGGSNIILPPGSEGFDVSEGKAETAVFAENVSLKAFPNPTSGSLTIELQGKLSEGRLFLFDASGRQVWQSVTDEENNTYRLDESQVKLQQGLYLLLLRQEDGRQVSQKIIVEQ